jgi:gliding motility-associated-like protein
MIKKTIVYLVLLLPLAVLAQPYTSKNGKFQVDQIKGCAPLTIILTTLLPGGCVPGLFPCAIDFDGDGALDDGSLNPSSFLYTNPGTYRVVVGYQNSQPDTIFITVVPNLQPTFDVYTCNGNNVQVKVTDTNYDQYQISYNGGLAITVPKGSLAKDNETLPPGANTLGVQGLNFNAADNCVTATKTFTAVTTIPLPNITSLNSLTETEIELNYNVGQNVLGRLDIAQNNNTSFQQLKAVYNDLRDTIASNLNNNSSYYCFRIGAVDACTNSVSYTQSVCSIVFKAEANNGFNNLEWNTNTTNVNNYAITRDAQPGYVGGIAKTINSYADQPIPFPCNIESSYSITANYAGAVATSLTRRATFFTTAKSPMLLNLNANINDNGAAEVIWKDAPEAVLYSIFKNTQGNSFSLETTQAEAPYLDAKFSTQSPSCYKVGYTDACTNATDLSIEACAVVLNASLASNNEITLTWSNYLGWQNGVVGYRLEKYSESGALLNTFSVGLTNTFLDQDDDLTNQVFHYRVFALPVDITLDPAFSNLKEVVKKPAIYYPKAFTPNNDNLNDGFRVFGQFIAEFDMKIFNRWGELVFTTNNIEQAWDGTFRGKQQPEGTYVFSAIIVDFSGKRVAKSGSVLLVKK